jgi:hypothetical protein
MYSNLDALLQARDISPLEQCRAIRYVVLSVLTADLPEGLYGYQERVSDLIIELATNELGEEGIVNQCRQSGKTEAVVVSLITLAIFYCRVRKKSFRVGIFAPAATQTILTVKERLRKRCISARHALHLFGLKLVVGEGINSELFILRHVSTAGEEYDFRVRCFSISPEANITSETLNLIIIEQTEDVDTLKMTNDVFPMAAAVGGARLLDGTPKAEVINTYFYDACVQREYNVCVEHEVPIQQWQQDPRCSNCHRNCKVRSIKVDYNEAGEANPKYKSYCNEMIDKLGINSIAFRTQFGCEWRLGVDKLCIRSDFEKKNLLRKYPVFNPIVDGRHIFQNAAGWDVAKAMDHGVVTFGWREVDHTHVTEWMMFEGDDYTDQVEKVAFKLVENHVGQICVDSAGVGDPVVDMLRKALRTVVECANCHKVYDRKIPGMACSCGSTDGAYSGVKVRVVGIKTNAADEDDKLSKLLVKVFKDGLFDLPNKDEAKAMGGYEQVKCLDMFITECCDLEKRWRGNALHTCAPKGEDRHDDYPKSFGLLLRGLLNPPMKISVRAIDF